MKLLKPVLIEMILFMNKSLEQIICIGKKSSWHEKYFSNFNYQKVVGYFDTSLLSALISAYMSKIEKNLEVIELQFFSLIFQMGMKSTLKNIPCYWLTKEFQKKILSKAVPINWLSIKPLLPYGFIFLPPGIETPEKKSVNWIYFDFFSKDITQPTIKIRELELNYNDLGVHLNFPKLNLIFGSGDIHACGTISLEPNFQGMPNWKVNFVELKEYKKIFTELTFTEEENSVNQEEFFITLGCLILQIMAYQEEKKLNGNIFNDEHSFRKPVWIQKNIFD